MSKRTVTIGLIVAGLVIVGIVAYFAFFRAGNAANRPTVIYFHAGG